MEKDLKIINKNNDSATIVYDNNSKIFNGSITVSYFILEDLDSIIQNKNLGKILNNDNQTILNAINEKNKLDIKGEDVEIINKLETSAEIKANDNSNYQGSAIVKFEMENDISKIIEKDHYLGSLKDKNSETIYKKIISEFPKLVDNIEVIDIGERNAKVIAKKDSKYEGTSTVIFDIKQQINTIIKNNEDIGKITVKKSENKESIIKKTILKKFNILNDTDIEVKVNEDNVSATITATDNSDYLGNVRIKFSVGINLEDIIIDKELGSLIDNKESTILSKINQKNKLHFTKEDVQITVENEKAIVKAKEESRYSGEITTKFTIKKQLSTIIKNTKLGKINNTSFDIIINKIISLNSEVSALKDKLIIKATGTNDAEIGILDDSDYQGTVNVTFELKQHLNNVITNLQLGKIDFNDKEKTYEDTILKAINNVNSSINLKKEEVEIKKNSDILATVTAADDSDYIGKVTVQYIVVAKLEDVIKITDLGGIKDSEHKTIKNKIFELNKNNGFDIVDIKIISINKIDDTYFEAIIGSEETSRFIGEVKVKFRTTPIDLKIVLKNIEIGKIEGIASDKIIQKVVEKNPNLNPSDIKVKPESMITDNKKNEDGTTNGTVIISSANGFNYSGEVKIKFLLD